MATAVKFLGVPLTVACGPEMGREPGLLSERRRRSASLPNRVAAFSSRFGRVRWSCARNVSQALRRTPPTSAAPRGRRRAAWARVS